MQHPLINPATDALAGDAQALGDLLDRVEAGNRILPVGHGTVVPSDADLVVEAERIASAAAWRASTRARAWSACWPPTAGAMRPGNCAAQPLNWVGGSRCSVGVLTGSRMPSVGRHDLLGCESAVWFDGQLRIENEQSEIATRPSQHIENARLIVIEESNVWRRAIPLRPVGARLAPSRATRSRPWNEARVGQRDAISGNRHAVQAGDADRTPSPLAGVNAMSGVRRRNLWLGQGIGSDRIGALRDSVSGFTGMGVRQ
jgi:hypothetical protein